MNALASRLSSFLSDLNEQKKWNESYLTKQERGDFLSHLVRAGFAVVVGPMISFYHAVKGHMPAWLAFLIGYLLLIFNPVLIILTLPFLAFLFIAASVFVLLYGSRLVGLFLLAFSVTLFILLLQEFRDIFFHDVVIIVQALIDNYDASVVWLIFLQHWLLIYPVVTGLLSGMIAFSVISFLYGSYRDAYVIVRKYAWIIYAISLIVFNPLNGFSANKDDPIKTQILLFYSVKPGDIERANEYMRNIGGFYNGMKDYPLLKFNHEFPLNIPGIEVY